MKIKIALTVETQDFEGRELLKEFQNLIADIDKTGASELLEMEIWKEGLAGNEFHWRTK